jgi:N-acyl-L-homoserine lactone synthetase
MARSDYHLSNSMIGFLFKVISRLQGYEYSIASTEEDLQAAYRLRESIFADELFGEKIHYPDRYDPHSTVLLAWHRGEVIGTVRLIRVEKSSLALDCYNFALPEHVERAQVLEFGGLVVSRQHRGKGKYAFLGMCDLAFQYSLKHGYLWWMGVATLNKIEYFRKLNKDSRVLSVDKPLPQHLKNRELYPGYFTEGKNPPRPFLMDNRKGSYLGAILGALKRK